MRTAKMKTSDAVEAGTKVVAALNSDIPWDIRHQASKLQREVEIERSIRRAKVEAVRIMLRERDRRRLTLVDPRHSKFLSFWDAVSGAALAYTAIVTPFETAFIDSSGVLDVWFFINRLIDTVFASDMVLQFFVMFETFDQELRQYYWVSDSQQIRMNYLKTWFFIDLLALLPSSFDIYPFIVDTADDSTSRLQILRVVRTFRLTKLVRLLKASRIVSRWR